MANYEDLKKKLATRNGISSTAKSLYSGTIRSSAVGELQEYAVRSQNNKAQKAALAKAQNDYATQQTQQRTLAPQQILQKGQERFDTVNAPVATFRKAQVAKNEELAKVDLSKLKSEIDGYSSAIDIYNNWKIPTLSETKSDGNRYTSLDIKAAENQRDNYIHKVTGGLNIDETRKLLTIKTGEYNTAYKAQEPKLQAEQFSQLWELDNYSEDKAKAGLSAYSADKEAENNKSENKKWWETLGEQLATVPSTDSPISSAVSNVRRAYESDTSYKEPSDEWNNEQRNIFGYLYSFDKNKAHDYAIQVNNSINKAKTDEQRKKIEKSATSGFWSGAANAFGAVLSAPLGLANWMDAVIETSVRGKTTNKGFLTPHDYSETVTEVQSKELNKLSGTLPEKIPIIGGKGLGDVYGLATSMVQSSLAAATGSSATALISFFGSAAASGMKEARERGVSDDKAVLYGFAAGLAEAIPEMLAVDKLLNLKSADSILKKLNSQGFTEGLTEGMTSVLTQVSDNIINGDFSQYNTLKQQYIKEGLAETDAEKKAWSDIAGNIAFDTLAGYAMGGIQAAPIAIGQAVKNRKAESNLNGTPTFSFGVTQKDIDDYVDNSYSNTNTLDYKKYAEVSDRLASEVDGEIDLTGYVHALRDNDIRHIKNSHGEATNEKYPVTKEDIKQIPNIVENYDKVIVFNKSSNKTGLVYVKVANDGLVYYLEQVTTKYGNEPLLVNKQMIKTGISDIPNIKGLEDAINKKQKTAEFLADLKVRQVYAQSVYQQSSTSSISNSIENVNGYKKETSQTTDANSPGATPNSGNASISSNNTVPQSEQTVNNIIPENSAENSSVADNNDTDTAPTGITELSAADKRKDAVQKSIENVTGYKELTEDQKTIRDIGHQLGWKVVFAPVSTPKGRKADGKISFATKTITIDPTSKKPIQFILKHELAHSLEQNKGAYSEFQNAIMDCQAFKDYVKAQGFESASEYNADIVARYKAEGVEGFDNTNAEYKANCEMVANFVGNCLFGGNTEITAKLLEGMNTAQRRSFTEWIKDFFAKIRDKLSGKHKGLTDEISRLEDAFLKTLNSVQQKENTADVDGESYSFNENLHQQLQDWLNGGGQKNGTYNGLYFELGTTPSILTKHGGPSAEIVMYSDVIVKVTGGKHSISLDEIAKLPAQLNDPILLFKGSVPNSFVALTEIVDKNGNDVIVAVHINKRHSRTVVNKIASLYSKSDDFGNNKIIGYIKNQISAGNLIDASNTKAPNWFTSRGLQLPKEVQTILGANNRIAQKPPIVKNNSMQESDEYSLNAKENTADVDGEADAYSINEDFYSEFDAWDGKDTNKVFTIGTTSEALKSVNIKNQEIKMRSGMILQKLSKHPEMSREIFRNIPDLLEQPIIVQFSDAIDQKTGKPKYDSRITVLGELYANMVVDGKNVQKPVLVSLELLPTNQKKTKILDVSFVTSAYTKDALQQYINENSILYIEPNKKRTNKWLSLNRLSLPLGENQTGPIRKITYSDGKVKVQNSTKKTEMQLALEKAGVINSYGNSIFNNSRNDTSDNESFSISSASTSHTEILTQLKNGEITVEEEDRLLYNSIGGNGDTHYGEHIHHTPSDYKPTSEREWQVFCRSFANQTNGMKDGEYRAVSVFTADAHYLISADGYMSGVIVDKISIDEYEERKEFYDNIPRANVSNFRNEENGSGQGNYSNSGIASQDEGTDSFDVELDAFIESHSEWFANKGKTRSNYSRIIEKSTETDESYSISEKTDIDSVLDAVSRGEMSTEEAKALLSRKKPLSPAEIANMKEADANTTPKLKRRQGENKGDKESRFYKSLMGSSIFDDTFKQEAADDSFIQKYQSVTNAETLKKAAEALDEGGEEYVKRWDIIKPEEASLIDTAVGFILMDRYQRVGDYHSAIKVAEKVKAFGTAGGQKIQLFSILSRLDPNTMVIYSQRELTSAFNILQKKRTQKWIDQNASRFNLTDEEMEFIRRRTLQAAQLPEGRDKARLLAEIAALLQDKLPPERGQGMKALQRISMLLSPKTNERNFLGNAGMVPVFIASDFFGSGIDRIVSKQTGVRTTGMFDPKSVKGFAKGVFETMDDFRRHINTRNEELNRFETGKINKSGKAFNEQHTGRLAKQLNDCAKVLNALDRFTSFCLEMGDRPFYEMWYVNSINNQMKLNNTTEATPEMIQIACLEALQRTWQDTNKLVKVVTNAKDALNVLNVGGYGLGDIMVKFVKTPANLTKAIVDFSPAGVVKAIAVDAKNLRNAIEKGQYEASLQKKFVDSLSKGIAGSMLYVLAAALAGAGMLSGAGDEDKDVSNFEKYIQGMPEYSIKLFGKWWSYDWMQPVGSVFATVADYMKTRKENPDSTMYEDIIEAIRAGGEVLYNQSFMQSIQMLFTADNPIDGAIEAVLNDPSVLVPQFVSQIANVTDDYRRVTYEAGKPFETALNKVKIKIPGLRQTLDKQVDVLGRDVPNPQNNIFNAFFNPGNTYTDTSNAVTDEVYALLKRTGELSVIPRKAPYSITKAGITRQLTAEQTNDYQRMSGNISAELLEVIFDSSDYKELDDAQKVDIVTKVYDYAAKYAKAQLDIYDYETLSAIEGTKKNGEPILSKSLYNRLDAKAKQLLIDEAFYTKAELKCKGDTEKLVKLFMKQVKE